jgi:hypothetical protein
VIQRKQEGEFELHSGQFSAGLKPGGSGLPIRAHCVNLPVSTRRDHGRSTALQVRVWMVFTASLNMGERPWNKVAEL